MSGLGRHKLERFSKSGLTMLARVLLMMFYSGWGSKRT